MSTWNDKIAKIRNIGIMAHIDAGKTTTTERILFYTKKVHRMGEVHEGTAVMDWMPEEQERGITITAAATTCYWQDHCINIIDTPGHVDFTVEVERSIRVLDGAVILLDGVAGVEPQTETVWRQAKQHRVPAIFYINKLDRMGANPERCLSEIKKKLAPNACLIQLPIGLEQDFCGYVDVIEHKAFRYADTDTDNPGYRPGEIEIPEDLVREATQVRESLVETLADYDERIMELFLEGRSVPSALLKSVLRSEVIKGEIFPVLVGSSFKNKGVTPLLDAVLDFLPCPLDMNKAVVFSKTTLEEKQIQVTQDIAFLGLAFKVSFDAFNTKLVYVRVYNGKLQKGMKLHNLTENKVEKVARIFRMHANHSEEIEEALAGDIVAVVGFKFTRTGDTLAEHETNDLLEVMHFPEPVISLSFEAKSQKDAPKLEEVLQRVLIEDPTLKLTVNQETGQRLISGMGELHLEVVKDRIKREHNLDLRYGQPQVAYKETIGRQARYCAEIQKLIQNKNIFAGITLTMSPLPYGSGKKVTFKVTEKQLPKFIWKPLESAILSFTTVGYSGLYPLIDMEMIIEDVVFREGESTETAFQMAAHMAYEHLLKKCEPVLLEPVMKLEVLCPPEFGGEVLGDLNGRRGKILEVIAGESDMNRFEAEVPLAGMFGYATVLRSLTKGRASYVMSPLKFEAAPADVQSKIYQWS